MRPHPVALLVGALMLVGAAPASAQQDPAAVPAGVTAGGVDVSGQSLAQAQATLEQAFAPKANADLVLGVRGKPWKLTAADAKVKFDALVSAKRALRAKKPGDVPLSYSYSKRAVRAFVADVAGKVGTAPRNATLRIGIRKMTLRRAKHGYGLDQTAASTLVESTLDDINAPRTLHAKLERLSPKVNANDLRKQYSTVLTVRQSEFKVRLFKNLKYVKSYPIAVGQPAYPTPTGTFRILDKQVNPTWSVPNSPWAGELQGTTVEGGSAANPLKARWMGIGNGVGFHGTGEDYSIGTRASHGCMRMHVSDVVDLYKRVPVGTLVKIVR